MQLDTWRREQGLNLGQLAALLGIAGNNPARTVHRYLTLQRLPDRAMRRAIQEITKGQVADEDWPDSPSRPKAAA